ncbi:MAG: hypothetical protein RL497_1503 [Pseudomonadota bacterium]|jgi:glycosyltransferase involved in cell wall biosynthesis
MSDLVPTDLSVVICTYNNADSLRLTLAQLADQQYDNKYTIEFLVVDNNSKDHTADVVNEFCKNDARFINLFEGAQGLSHARNTGVNNAKGSYVLFTDDDADLPTDWVQSYLQVLEEYQPVCCYSKISVQWHKPQPWWYCQAFRAQFVELDYGLELINVHDINHEFFGKNFCLLRDEILKQGGFDPKLGRMGDKLVAGEETVIYRRIIQSGKKVVYFPWAEVGHRLKDKEFTSEHITRLFLDGAYTTYNVGFIFSTKWLLGRPVGVLLASVRLMVFSAVSWLNAGVNGNNPLRFYHKLSFLKSIKTIKLWVCKP